MPECNRRANQLEHIPTIAIVGRPNVGKSSLFNTVVGHRLSIVHEMPGVTRDRVVAVLVRQNSRFQLVDTGGLGVLAGETRNVDTWDSRIATQVELAINDADVLVMVVNTQDGIASLDEVVASRLRTSGKPVLLAVNKCDNPTLEEDSVEFTKLGFDKLFPISCLHRRGINELLEVALKLLPRNLAPDSAGEAPKLKPLNIAVVGRPNVGKSSLVNALLGEERMMVSEVAGTTRDSIDVDFTLNYQGEDRPAVLVDTAGLRKKTKVDSVVELFSVMRTQSAIKRVDFVLMIVEASPDGMTAQDRRIASMIREAGKACVIVANKFDLQQSNHKIGELENELRYSLPGMDFAPVVFISAKDHYNLDGLLDCIAQVMDRMELNIPTGILNRVLADAFENKTPPMIGPAPLKLYYASMTGMTPPRVLLFVNNPKYCADNYIAYLRNTLSQAFDLTGVPLFLELRARPKKVESIRHKVPSQKAKSRTFKSTSKRKPELKTKRNTTRRGVLNRKKK